MIYKSAMILCVSIFTLLIVVGCEIEPFPDSLTIGSLEVSAMDNDGMPIEGASIFINGAEQPRKTPASFHGLDEGAYDLVVQKFGFWSDSSIVDVLVGDTVSIGASLGDIPDSMSIFLEVDSTPAGARLLINGKTFLVEDEIVTTPLSIELPWNLYSFSVHMAGFTTINPILPQATTMVGDTTSASFMLEEGDVGGNSGMIPFDFTLENDEADSIRLSDLRGQVVLINFWYADCVPCMNEFPGIETVYREFASEGFNVLGINPMYPDDREDVIEVRTQLGLSFQLLLDWDRHVSVNQYDANPYPRNILVDRTGRITDVLQGVEEDELRELVKELIDHSE